MVNRKGIIAARKVFEETGYDALADISINDFALGLGAFVKEEPMSAEGRIVFSGDDAIITLNSNIDLITKKRFILAHELGHFRMHKALSNKFEDTGKTLNDWLAKGEHELEANDFAKEFLMPEHIFKPIAKGKFSFDLIKSLAIHFNTSLTSTFLRYGDLGDFPVALVYSENKIVKWTQFSDDFVMQFIPYNSKIPVYSVAWETYEGENYNSPESVEAKEWFANDYKLKYNLDLELYEQCFKVADNAVLSCIWTK